MILIGINEKIKEECNKKPKNSCYEQGLKYLIYQYIVDISDIGKGRYDIDN